MSYCREHAEIMAKVCEKMPQAAIRKKFVEMAEHFGVLNVAESKALAKKYRCRIKECYANCATIARKDKRYAYVEGYGMSVIPMEHAWLVNEKGEVVDPTWTLTNSVREPDYFGLRVPIEKLEFNGYEPGWLKPILEALGYEKEKAAS